MTSSSDRAAAEIPEASPFLSWGDRLRDWGARWSARGLSPEARLARWTADVTAALSALLGKPGFTVDFARALAPRARCARRLSARLTAFSLAPRTHAALQAARDVLTILEIFRGETALFDIRPDAAARTMARGVAHAAAAWAAALADADRRPAAARRSLEEARVALREVHRAHEDALADLLRRAGAVEVLKTREGYRHLSRVAESLSRALPSLDASLAETTLLG